MLKTTDISVPSELYKKYATVYTETSVPAKAAILYFHGGGLLYGQRSDLPQLHIDDLTQAGYVVIAYDYPLAPVSKLDVILPDVISSVNDYIENPSRYGIGKLPFFIWGRSAGAYLALMAGAAGHMKDAIGQPVGPETHFLKPPAGILSYYGYGFLEDQWFSSPAPYYQTLPPVPASILDSLPDVPYADAPLDTFFSLYVYVRQTGKWKEMIYDGRDKYFYLNYTLRMAPSFPCPLFCAHSTGDPDVPFEEFTDLCNKYNPTRFIASRNVHDFDRDEEDPFTSELLLRTIHFCDEQLRGDFVS